MKLIPRPQIDYSDVINICIDSIETLELRNRLKNIAAEMVIAGSDYMDKADRSVLNEIAIFEGIDTDVVLKRVTKKELKNLYTNHMVPSGKPARSFYDRIKLSAELGICPFCGFGHVNTLDHFLPKSKFPLISILPINLVPCCADCNKGKTSRVALRAEQLSLHPYFNDLQCITEQWIFANVEHSYPAVIKYYVEPPAHWDRVLAERVKNHFNDYHLKSRFAVQAGNELASLIHELKIDYDISGAEGVKNSLVKKALASSMQEKNSWKTAMYLALSKDEWFFTEGFLTR